MNKWLIIGGGAIAGYLLSRNTGHRATPEDVEYLSRILLVEAGSVPDSDEWAGIAGVVLNRVESSRYPNTIREVVATPRWFGAASTGYERVNSGEWARSHRNWDRAVSFARRVLSGEVANPVGRRTHFFHPGGMPSCSASETSSTKKCVNGRWVPLWGLSRSDGGRAEYEPLRIGRAIFA